MHWHFIEVMFVLLGLAYCSCGQLVTIRPSTKLLKKTVDLKIML